MLVCSYYSGLQRGKDGMTGFCLESCHWGGYLRVWSHPHGVQPSKRHRDERAQFGKGARLIWICRFQEAHAHTPLMPVYLFLFSCQFSQLRTIIFQDMREIQKDTLEVKKILLHIGRTATLNSVQFPSGRGVEQIPLSLEGSCASLKANHS